MRRLRLPGALLLAIVIASASAAGCGNPEVRSREFLKKGDDYAARKDFANATIEYRRAVQANPASVDAHLKLAGAYLEDRDLRNAVREYSRAADLRADDLTLQLTVARLLELGGAFVDATTRIKYVLNKDPNNIDAQILLGKALLGAKDPDGAMAHAEAMVSRSPGEGRAYSFLGIADLAKGQREAAEAAFRRAIELDPKSPQAHLAMGYFYWADRQVAEAERAFLKSLELDPSNVFARRMLTTLYLAVNRPAEAEKQLKAIAEASNEPEPRLDFADFYLDRNRFQEARDLLATLVSDPRVARAAKERLAIIAFQQGRQKDAIALVDEVLKQSPNNINALNTKIRMLIADRRLDEAMALAKTAVTASPGSPTARFLLASIYAQQNNVPEAIKAFSEVLKLDPTALPVQLNLARLYLDNDQAMSALGATNEALGREPNHPDAHFLHARALLETGQLKAAETELSELARLYPRSTTVQTELGTIAARNNNLIGARLFYQHALELDATNLNALSLLVRLEIGAGQPAQARRVLQAPLAKAPNDPVLLVLLATTYTAEKDTATSEATLKRVLALDPTNMAAYTRLGRIYINSGRMDQALAEYRHAADLQPSSVPALTMVGLILEAQRKTDEAVQQYERVLKIDPNAAVAANNLASIYLDRNQKLDTALGLAQRAKLQMPDDPAVSDTLGWILYVKNAGMAAVPPLQLSVEKEPKNPIYQYHLGMAYLRVKDFVAARACLERALKLSPSFPGAEEARKALASMFADKGQPLS